PATPVTPATPAAAGSSTQARSPTQVAAPPSPKAHPSPKAPSSPKAPPSSKAPAPPTTRAQWFAPTGEELTRSQRRDAEARANLKPLAPGEHPMAIRISALVAALLGLANLVAWLAGDKIGGKHPAAGGIFIFSAVMLVCAIGLWRMWYGAVLGFMALLAIIATLFSLYLLEASNALGFVVAPIIIVAAGYLFFKLVRVLSRIQMPQRPGS
ncbi:MAG TPA: hypothetical protein VE571_12210, partial [Solirubrobacteraceae bacterium]|nr:hypothetical protein [Solirubrobacteraceae bacterium]